MSLRRRSSASHLNAEDISVTVERQKQISMAEKSNEVAFKSKMRMSIMNLKKAYS